jgi:hypothetical protein
MLDVDTFLTTLYVSVDDFCQSHPTTKKPAPKASLSESEVITLVVFARWSRFASERDFYRYAEGNLLDAFPTLPNRSQFNRLARSKEGLIESLALHLATLLGAQKRPYEALDSLRRCLPETPSAGDMGGWPAPPTSAGVIALRMVRGFPSARRGGSHRGSHRLRVRQHRRPAGGRNLLRPQSLPEP